MSQIRKNRLLKLGNIPMADTATGPDGYEDFTGYSATPAPSQVIPQVGVSNPPSVRSNTSRLRRYASAQTMTNKSGGRIYNTASGNLFRRWIHGEIGETERKQLFVPEGKTDDFDIMNNKPNGWHNQYMMLAINWLYEHGREGMAQKWEQHYYNMSDRLGLERIPPRQADIPEESPLGQARQGPGDDILMLYSMIPQRQLNNGVGVQLTSRNGLLKNLKPTFGDFIEGNDQTGYTINSESAARVLVTTEQQAPNKDKLIEAWYEDLGRYAMLQDELSRTTVGRSDGYPQRTFDPNAFYYAPASARGHFVFQTWRDSVDGFNVWVTKEPLSDSATPDAQTQIVPVDVRPEDQGGSTLTGQERRRLRATYRRLLKGKKVDRDNNQIDTVPGDQSGGNRRQRRIRRRRERLERRLQRNQDRLRQERPE